MDAGNAGHIWKDLATLLSRRAHFEIAHKPESKRKADPVRALDGGRSSSAVCSASAGQSPFGMMPKA